MSEYKRTKITFSHKLISVYNAILELKNLAIHHVYHHDKAIIDEQKNKAVFDRRHENSS